MITLRGNSYDDDDGNFVYLYMGKYYLLIAESSERGGIVG